MAEVAVIGAGAIGSTVAAWLGSTGRHLVRLCVRTPVDHLHVDTPSGPLTSYPFVLTDPSKASEVDWVLVATKTYDATAVGSWLERLVGPDTLVAILQNGVEHDVRFVDVVEAQQIVPVIVDVPAERVAPGRVSQRRMGTMVVPEGSGGRAFLALFAGTPFTVSTATDFVTASWRKLAINCAGAVNALALQFAGIVRDAGVAELMAGLVAECIAVGRAEGADLPDDLVRDVVQGYRDGPADAINSLHADRLAGRRMEWDARNGVIVRFGERHGVPTPLNRFAATMLRILDA
jgi:2-dehydropantoate 2-reductase